MLNLIERLLLALAVLLSLALGGAAAVTTYAFPAGLRGAPPQVLAAEVGTQDWLTAQRARRGVRPQAVFTPAPAESPLRQPKRGAAFRRAVRQVIARTAPTRAPREAVPGVPWLPRVPGVRYQPRRVVSRLVHQHLQTLEGTRQALEQGSGRFVATDHGDAYQLDAIAPRSHLARSGLQPGDQVLAVNGLPLGQGPAAARALFERLRGERRFSILVLRRGQRVVIPVEVE